MNTSKVLAVISGSLLTIATLSAQKCDSKCYQLPNGTMICPPSPSPAPIPSPSSSTIPNSPSPSPIETPTPLPSIEPSPSPIPSPSPTATPCPSPSVVDQQCTKCEDELASLPSVGYFTCGDSPSSTCSDPRFFEMDNCRAGDTKACTYISKVELNFNGKTYPACTFFNSRWQARKEGIPPANGICLDKGKSTSNETECPPIPTPSVSPSAPPTGQTDVARLILLVVAGSPCKIPGVQFVWEVGCKEAFLTATPKAASGADAKFHSRNLRWFMGENCVSDSGIHASGCNELTSIVSQVHIGIVDIWSQGEETLFNKWMHPTDVGKFKLWVAIQEPPTPEFPTGFFWQMREVTVKR